ncbi:MAG: DUF3048 domain-containing protein [Acidimicrobiales bacterium]
MITQPDPTVPTNTPVAPLTGLALTDPRAASRPALVVKVDNADTSGAHARPQAGLVAADVVFEQLVEGGITRLVAVFQSQVPGPVGPVRSARTTDPPLVGQLNRPLFAWSGGNGGVIAAVRAGPLIDVGFAATPSAYYRHGGRRAPHNLFVHPSQLYRRSPQGSGPPSPLFRFRPAGQPLAPTSEAVRGVRLDFGGVASAPVTYEYDAATDGWRRRQSGSIHVDADGTAVAPRNVLVLFTRYRPSPADARSPEAQSVGTGQAWVFSKGGLVRGTWSRTALDRPADLRDSTGRVIELTPGKTWVELPKEGQAAVLW